MARTPTACNIVLLVGLAGQEAKLDEQEVYRKLVFLISYEVQRDWINTAVSSRAIKIFFSDSYR